MKRPKNAAGNADKNTVCSRIFFPLLQTHTTPAPSRRATSLIMDRQLLDHARALGVNVSRAAEARLSAASKEALEAEWKRKNAGAFADYNAYIEENRH